MLNIYLVYAGKSEHAGVMILYKYFKITSRKAS